MNAGGRQIAHQTRHRQRQSSEDMPAGDEINSASFDLRPRWRPASRGSYRRPRSGCGNHGRRSKRWRHSRCRSPHDAPGRSCRWRDDARSPPPSENSLSAHEPAIPGADPRPLQPGDQLRRDHRDRIGPVASQAQFQIPQGMGAICTVSLTPPSGCERGMSGSLPLLERSFRPGSLFNRQAVHVGEDRQIGAVARRNGSGLFQAIAAGGIEGGHAQHIIDGKSQLERHSGIMDDMPSRLISSRCLSSVQKNSRSRQTCCCPGCSQNQLQVLRPKSPGAAWTYMPSRRYSSTSSRH